jgi:hypothetical protein
MSNRSVPNLQERLKSASEAKKLMLAKFKTSLVEGPAAIEKRRQRQAIAAARAERAVQREEVRQRQERELAKQAEIAAQAAADAARAAADQRAKRPNRQNEMRCWRLNRRRPAMPVTRPGRQQRKSGGVATNAEALRIAANIAKLPDLLKRRRVWQARAAVFLGEDHVLGAVLLRQRRRYP